MRQANCVIIGGGVIGLSIAYFLSKKGMSNVELVEQSYVGSGASTRNASNIASWHEVRTLENVNIEKLAFMEYRKFSSEIQFNILHENQTHYCLAFTEQHVRALESVVEAHRKIGLDTSFAELHYIREIMPFLNLKNVVEVARFGSGAKVHHDAVVRGLLNAAMRNGVTVHDHTKVINLETQNGNISAVDCGDLRIQTPLVVNSAGAWSSQIGKMVGISMPVESRKREMIVTESMNHFTDNLVTSLDTDVYFNQTLRGEILIGGLEDGEIITDYNQLSTLDFARRASSAIVKLVPAMKNVNILRTWAGLRDRTPDGNPLVGPEESVSGFFQANAFFGYGLTWAPIIGRAIADFILGEKPQINIDNFLPSRFES